MQGVSFIGNVLLFLCCDGCDVQSFLFFQPLLIFTLAFLAVEKLNHRGIKAACKGFNCFIRVAGLIRLFIFIQRRSSESVTSDVLHADSPPVPCYFPVFDRHSGRTESPLAE